MSGFAPTDEQLYALDAYKTGLDLVIEACAGSGKALRDDQPVVTPTGYRPIGSLRVGDLVAGTNGTFTHVTGVYPQGVKPLVEITLTGNTRIVATYDHLWSCQTKAERDRARGWKVRTTADLVRMLDSPTTRSIWLPMAEPVGGPSVDLPIDPWLLGVLIGDGGLTGRTINLCNPDAGILAGVAAVLPEGVTVAPGSSARPDGLNWRLTAGGMTAEGRRGMVNPLGDAMLGLNIRGKYSYNKIIPAAYLYASASQRLALLQGLFDTDGCAAGHTLEWGTTSLVLAQQVRYLVASLGGISSRALKVPTYTHNGERRTGRPYWRFYVRMPGDVLPFRSSEKAERYTPRTKYQPARRIVSIIPVDASSATCIKVDAADHLFLTTDCVPTHNTSTLLLLAESAPSRRGQYTAFNKAIVSDVAGVMPSQITCSTVHSLAFRAIGHRFKHRIDSARMRSSELADALRVEQIGLQTQDGQDKHLSASYLASLVMKGVTLFCQSADDEPGQHHIPYVDGIDIPTLGGQRTYQNNNRLREYLVPFMAAAWADWSRPDGQLPYKHDAYLKIWQLSSPRINADVLYVDEAQDLSPVFISIFDQQRHMQRVYVGDSQQEIYGWMGAQNALGTLGETARRATLSQSFRFGDEVAEVANRILGFIPGAMQIRGTPSIPSVVQSCSVPSAVLTRSNACAVRTLLGAVRAGQRVHMVGGGDQVSSFCRGADELQQGRPTQHFELACFTTWQEVRDYVREDAQGSELKLLTKLVDDFGARTILYALGRMPREKDADLVISTAHRAKGRAWPSVQLAGDFPNAEEQMPSVEELRLLYVAVTRARVVLDVEAVVFPNEALPLAAEPRAGEYGATVTPYADSSPVAAIGRMGAVLPAGHVQQAMTALVADGGMK